MSKNKTTATAKPSKPAKPVDKPVKYKGTNATLSMQPYVSLKPNFAARLTFQTPLDYYVEVKKAGERFDVPANIDMKRFIDAGDIALAPSDENEEVATEVRGEQKAVVGNSDETFAGKIDLDTDPFGEPTGDKTDAA
jgi:hypothetical protein